MAVVQFIISIIVFICSAAMVLASLFVHPNTNIVAIALLSLIFFGCIHLVKSVTKNLNQNSYERYRTLQADH